jgi:uncharacterized membrane protein YfcA
MLIGLVVLGIVAGALAGLVGVGGGVVIVPALVYIFGFSQKMAQGTSLALLLPPIGILAAYTYYRAGQVDVRAALVIIIGFLIGSLITARYANQLNSATLVRIFGVFLLIVAIKMIITAK